MQKDSKVMNVTTIFEFDKENDQNSVKSEIMREIIKKDKIQRSKKRKQTRRFSKFQSTIEQDLKDGIKQEE